MMADKDKIERESQRNPCSWYAFIKVMKSLYQFGLFY